MCMWIGNMHSIQSSRPIQYLTRNHCYRLWGKLCVRGNLDNRNSYDVNMKVCKSRSHHEGESTEKYIKALYDLADNYGCGDLKSEMIRDRLVVRIRDTTLSEWLQMDAELTLEKAKMTIFQREAVHEPTCAQRGRTKYA